MPKRYVRARAPRRARRYAGAPKRKSYTRRSRAPAARRRRRVARDFAPAVPGLKNTKTVWLTHRLMQVFELANDPVNGPTQQQFVIRANSPYDPVYATGTGQLGAVGFNYYANIYTKYRCTESTQQIKFIATGQNGYSQGVALVVHDLAHEDEVNGVYGPSQAGPAGAVGGLILSTLKPGASHRMVTTGSGLPVTMSRRYISRAAFGVTPTTGADECLVNENPTRTALYKTIVTNQGFNGDPSVVSAIPNVLGTLMITTRYKVKFLSPKDMTVSM